MSEVRPKDLVLGGVVYGTGGAKRLEPDVSYAYSLFSKCLLPFVLVQLQEIPVRELQIFWRGAINGFESTTKGDTSAKFSETAVRTTSADMESKGLPSLEAKFCWSETICFQTLGIKTSRDHLIIYLNDAPRTYSRVQMQVPQSTGISRF